MWGSSGSADGQRSREVMTLPREVVHIVGAIVVGHVVTLAGVVALLNQSQGGMCIYNTSVIGLGFSQKSFGL